MLATEKLKGTGVRLPLREEMPAEEADVELPGPSALLRMHTMRKRREARTLMRDSAP
jgi:hypothetical protein